MPSADGWAASRRDRMLGQTRRLSMYVAAGAVAASIGLGGVFARELPGHQHLAGSQAQPGTAAPGAGRPGAPAPQPARPGTAPAASPSPEHQQLSQPAQPPASAPASAPAQTTSGGS